MDYYAANGWMVDGSMKDWKGGGETLREKRRCPMERWNQASLGRSAMSFDPKPLPDEGGHHQQIPPQSHRLRLPQMPQPGHVAVPKEDGVIFFRSAAAMAIRRVCWEMRSRPAKHHPGKTFEAFLDREPWQKAIKAGVMATAKAPRVAAPVGSPAAARPTVYSGCAGTAAGRRSGAFHALGVKNLPAQGLSFDSGSGTSC